MPKQLHYSFGNSAGREAFQRVYNPLDNSPRGTDSKMYPGPGEYQFRNKAIGIDAKKFSFLQRTKNHQGK